MNSKEQEIIELLAKGDRKAIELLYDNYADTLFGVIKNIIKDDGLAKDVLQDTFVKFWKKGKTYDPEKAKLFTWLLRITRNTAIDKYRSINNRGDKEIQTSEFNVNIKSKRQFSPQLLDMGDHVARLDLKYREIIRALFYQGMTQKEASEALNLPLGTVKTRLRDGLKNLRKVFGDKDFTIMILISMLS